MDGEQRDQHFDGQRRGEEAGEQADDKTDAADRFERTMAT